MATRAITGTVLRPSGAPWAGGDVTFSPQDDAFTLAPDQTIPMDVVTAVVGSGGTFSVVLVSGLNVLYTVTLPDRSTFPIAVPDGGATTLEMLRADTSIAPVPVETVQEVIDDIIAGTYVAAAGGSMSGDLVVAPPTGAAGIDLNPSGANHAELRLRRGGVTKWRVRNVGSDDHFALVNEALGSNAVEIDDANNAITVAGATRLSNLAGAGSRFVTADAEGDLTAGAVTSANIADLGMVLVHASSFSGVASHALPTNVLTSSYENYLVAVNITDTSAATNVGFKLRAAGVDISSANYDYSVMHNVSSAAAFVGTVGAATTLAWLFGGTFVGAVDAACLLYLRGPQLPRKTTYHATSGWYATATATANQTVAGGFRLTTQVDSLTLFGLAGTISGNVRAYGLRDG